MPLIFHTYLRLSCDGFNAGTHAPYHVLGGNLLPRTHCDGGPFTEWECTRANFATSGTVLRRLGELGV